jgi:hypothetical protein
MTPRRSLVLPVIAISCLGVACRSVTSLQPELPAQIRVGDIAEISVDRAPHYSMNSAGTSLTLVKKKTEQGASSVYVFRAVTPGQQTFVLTPRDSGPDGCISCVTVHYFVSVVH